MSYSTVESWGTLIRSPIDHSKIDKIDKNKTEGSWVEITHHEEGQKTQWGQNWGDHQFLGDGTCSTHFA